ncbi:MAG: biopolymer transporter ExbD, partial [Pseudomonadota bacterium]
MAMNLGNGGGSGMRGTRHRPMSEINVTPFVDVMLVLLVVFMVTAPLLTVGVPVDLPKAKVDAISTPEEPIVISIDVKNRIY